MFKQIRLGLKRFDVFFKHDPLHAKVSVKSKKETDLLCPSYQNMAHSRFHSNIPPPVRINTKKH